MCIRLHLLVNALHLRAGILDRRRHVTGNDLGRIVVNPDQGCLFGIERSVITLFGNHTEGMGDHGHLQRMFGERLLPGIAHQRPAFDVFHSGDRGKKRIGHRRLSPQLSFLRSGNELQYQTSGQQSRQNGGNAHQSARHKDDAASFHTGKRL